MADLLRFRRAWTDVNLADQFQNALVDLLRDSTAGSDLLPLVLAQACVKVLPVSGAGLSLTDELRIPLAASDADAATAERLQTTLGEGPCLSAVAMDDYLVADAAAIATRWPIFGQEFLVQTPYRSVASLPLRTLDGVRVGALDLYCVDARPIEFHILEEADLGVATPIASMLFRQPITDAVHAFTTPAWLATDSANARMKVWVAIGMLMASLGLPNADALAVLRGYAYSGNRSLDEVAKELTDRQLKPDQLLM